MNDDLCLLFDADSELDLSTLLNLSLNCPANFFAFYRLSRDVIKYPTKIKNISRYSIPLLKVDPDTLESKFKAHDLTCATRATTAKIVLAKKFKYSNGIHIVNMNNQNRLKLLVEAVMHDSY